MVASFDQPLDDMRTGLRQQSQAGSVFSLCGKHRFYNADSSCESVFPLLIEENFYETISEKGFWDMLRHSILMNIGILLWATGCKAP